MNARARHSGMVNVWVVLLGLAMAGIVGLACDFSYVYYVRQQLQSAADAAALGGADRVRVDTLAAVRKQSSAAGAMNTAAKAAVLLEPNETNAAGGDIVIGRYYKSTRVFVPTLTGANAVEVRTHRPDRGSPALQLIFAPIFGVNEMNLTRRALAVTIDGNGAAILVLDPAADSAFHMNGNSTISVDNGCIHVNSSSNQGVTAVGNPTVSVSDFNVCSTTADLSKITMSGNINTKAPFVADPLGGLAIPNASPTLSVPNGKNVTLTPGYYPSGIKWTNGTLTLSPGVYTFAGDGFQVNGGDVVGKGVFIFITGKNKAEFKLGGNGTIDLTPMTTGPYAGISVYQDPALSNQATIDGTPQMHVGGTLYFPGAKLLLGGTGDAFGTQIISNLLEVKGNSSITVNYDGRFPIPGKVMLAE